MGKRSNFERVERDYYPTPIKAVEPLVSHLTGYRTFIEPCAGDGRLVRHIEKLSDLRCELAFDIEPQDESVHKLDAFEQHGLTSSDCIITNPPWVRKVLHPMIEHFRKQADTWLLFDADWMHTKQSIDYMKYCAKVVSIGRVKWIENSKQTGKDNCCWYLFKREEVKEAIFYGRKTKEKKDN